MKRLFIGLGFGSLAVAFVGLNCSSSSDKGGEVCDFGAGGVTTQACDNFAAQGSCSTHNFTQEVH